MRTHLIFYEWAFGGASADTPDTGVLDGECCDDTCPITDQPGEYLQVRLKQTQESVDLSKILRESRRDLAPGGSFPAMVSTADRDMTPVKTALSATWAGKRHNNDHRVVRT